MPFNRTEDQCVRCACYYTNWSKQVEDDLGEELALTIECTHEFDTEETTPCVCFVPVEE